MRFRVIGVVALALLAPLRVVAQGDLKLTPEERDSVLKNYHQIFPIWGRQAIERGYDLPTPLGFNVGWFGAEQNIIISDLAVGFNNPPEPASFIGFEKAESKITNWNARVDLWVLPFLNFYLMAGTGDGQTKVFVSEPVKFETEVDMLLRKPLLAITAATVVAAAALSPSAHAGDPLLGALIGGGIGAAIGNSANHHNGAAVGGAIGAIVGAGIATADNRYYGDPAYGPGYYAPPAYHYSRPAYQQRDYYSRWGGSGGQPGYRGPNVNVPGPTNYGNAAGQNGQAPPASPANTQNAGGSN